MFVTLYTVDTGVTSPVRKQIAVNPHLVRRVESYSARQLSLDLTRIYFDATDSVIVVGSVEEVANEITTQTERYENDRDARDREASAAWRETHKQQHGSPEETDGTVLGISGDGKDNISVHSTGPEASDQL